LHQQASTRSLRHGLLLATTAAVWLVFALDARWYDRQTRGYRRPWIVMFAVLLVVASAAIHLHFHSPSNGLRGGAGRARIRGGATLARSPVIYK